MDVALFVVAKETYNAITFFVRREPTVILWLDIA